MGYKVKLNVFEGPFDLLVYLIENAQMSIYDIKVAEITTQYMDYLTKMKQMDVAIATEFMVLAASLIEIKSKLIIPRVGIEGEEVIDEDPRAELVERILEYKKFKHAAEILESCEDRELRIYKKPQEDLSKYYDAPDEYLSLDIKQFVNAFNMFLHKKRKLEYIKKNYARVERQKTTIEAKIMFIKDFFSRRKSKSVKFSELIDGETSTYNTVITFVSLLEMVRQKKVLLKQLVAFGEITVDQKECEMEETTEVVEKEAVND